MGRKYSFITRKKDDKKYYKEYYNMEFEWDEIKNETNKRKHGISISR